MKSREQVKPNYGPVYAAAMYPKLAEICVEHGYALAVHGSLARDLDLIAIPWVEKASDIDSVIHSITSTFAVRLIGEPGNHPHGRVVYTLSCGWGECAIDIGFMPIKHQ